MKSIPTKKGICTAIIVLLKANNGASELIKIYSDYQKKLATKLNDSYLDNKKNEKEEKNWITREEILEKIKEYKSILGNSSKKPENFNGTDRSFVDKFQQYLILNLYTLLPPLRNDYSELQVLDSSPENCNFNHIDLEGCRLVLCNYKTSKTYGTQIIDIPKELLVIINKFIKIKNENLKNLECNHLLINTTNLSSMTKNSLTKYLNKIFYPKKISSTILRKVYLSEKYPISHSVREMELDGSIMGHNISTARKVYTKFI